MIKIEHFCQKQDKILNIISTEIEGISYSLANKILRKKDVRLNGDKISENLVVNTGDKLTIFLPDDFKDNFGKKDKFFEAVFEDQNLIIINKFKGIEVCSPTENLTVENLLNKEITEEKTEIRKGADSGAKSDTKQRKVYALNRIDRNTEGLVIFAKTYEFFKKLKKAMKDGEIKKYYLAEVVGCPKWDNFKAIGYLQKDDEKSEVRIFDNPKKDSVKIETDITVLSRSSGGTSILIIKIVNGKTHQIRAHLAHIGHAIVGDGKYGSNQDNKKFKSKTQKLTAYRLTFSFTDKDLKYLNDNVIEIKPSWINKLNG
jgi:23S rRNA pseudouridine955/2504/2580 synthase